MSAINNIHTVESNLSHVEPAWRTDRRSRNMTCRMSSFDSAQDDWSWLKLIFIVIGITITDVFGLAQAQNYLPDIFQDRVYSPDIHTVLLRNEGWDFSLPVIEAGGNSQLELRFDDLSNQSRMPGYTLVHCDTGWVKSKLPAQEYLSGYGRGIIRESTRSFNTNIPYTHYRLSFPEEECKPLISGNYVIVVYEETDPDIILLTKRFFVSEKSATIEATVKQPGYGLQKETGQQVHFTVLHNNNEIRDPLNQVTAVVLQNNRYDNKIIAGRPYSVQPGRLEFTGPEDGIFFGGNEFRSLDIKSMRYQTENVTSIEFLSPYFHVFMKPDIQRSNKPYFSKTDLNGSFYIDEEKADDRHTESDYVYVHFNLQLPMLYTTDAVYITGEFLDWAHTSDNKMVFNGDNGLFESTLLLKQGLYDYCFIKEDPGTKEINEYEVEGSFFETENDYTILVYFHDDFKGIDRLIGYLPIK